MTSAEEIIDEVIEAHRFDKDGMQLIKDLIRLHSAQSQEARDELVAIYREWIRSGDVIRASWGIDLIAELGLVGELPFLEEVLQEIRDNRSKLPKYYEEFLVPAIEDLQRKVQS